MVAKYEIQQNKLIKLQYKRKQTTRNERLICAKT